MDEATWLSDAILLCKNENNCGPANSLQLDNEQNHLDCMQHYTDISNSFIDNNGDYDGGGSGGDGGGGVIALYEGGGGANKLLRLNESVPVPVPVPLSGLHQQHTHYRCEEYLELDSLHLCNSHTSLLLPHGALTHSHSQYDHGRRGGSHALNLPSCHGHSHGSHVTHEPMYHQHNERNNHMSSDHNHHHMNFRVDSSSSPIQSQYNNLSGHHDTSSSSTRSSASLTSSPLTAQPNNSRCSQRHNCNISSSSSNNNNNNNINITSYSLRTHVNNVPIRGSSCESKSDCESYISPHFSLPYNSVEDDSKSDSELQRIKEEKDTCYPVRRRPGRPRGSRRKKPEKLGRLWEFIRDLLLSPVSCPSLICWENYEEGMFRFVNSDKVAKLWGAKRDNPDMNYEKLSRAMRYYYKSNVLQPVFGRRLVYKFGPEARGWKTENPNFTC